MSMLEQAIIDAEELRRSATKLAEQKIIEKYSGEFKDALDALLEQDEIEMGEFGEGVTGELEQQIPQTNEELFNGDISEEDEEIEIDFTELEKQFHNSNNAFENVDEPVITAKINLEGDDSFPLSLNEENEDVEDDKIEEYLEEEINKVLEEFNFDNEVVPTGHAGAPTDREYEKAQEVMQVKNQLEKMNEENKSLKEKLESYKNKQKEQKDVIKKLSEHVSKINLTNAKLLYMNKILRSDSLNERQKAMMVGQLSEAKNVEQTKVVYETLKSTVGELSSKKQVPESLEQIVSENKGLSIHSTRKPESDVSQVMFKRWRKLAGN